MYIVLRPNLKECNPQTAKRRVGAHFSEVQARELNKHYANFFTLTPKAKRCLATSLGITVERVRAWMYRKWKRENYLEPTKQQLQTLHEQEHGTNVAGILTFYLYSYQNVFIFNSHP